MGLFIIGVVVAAWFGGAGPGVLAAFLSALSLPHLIAITYPPSVSYPLLAGFFDLPRFVTLGLTGAAVGWGRTSYRRAESALRERKHAEDGLRQSQQRYERVLGGAEVGDWEWDLVNGDYFVSARMREMLQLPPDLHFASREQYLAHVPFHPDDRQPYIEASEHNISNALPRFEHEYRVVLKGGEVRWMRVRGMSTLDAQGRPTHFSGSLVDITDRKRAEAALRLSEERYALAMEASADGIFDTDLDSDETFVSARLAEIYGFPRQTRVTDRVEWVKQIPFHPDDRHVVADLLRRHWDDPARDFYEFQYRIVPRPGETRWIHTRGMVTRDAQGRARRRIGVVADITARKLAADALRESEARFRTLTELSSDWYWEQDENLRFTYLSNQALALTGYSGESSLGKTRWEIANMTPLSCTWAEHQAVLAARQPFRDLECRRVGPDGAVRYLSMSGAPVFDEQGRFKGYQGVGRNITERKRAEEALRESQERYALAVAGSDDGVWDVDFAARRVFVSARARELAGMPPGPEIVPMDEWFANLPLHPEDMALRAAAMQAHLAGKTPAYIGEFRLRQLDGVYRWRRLRGLCLRDADGKPHRIAGSISDIDARKAAEEALRLSEERYALAMEVAEEGHFDWNVQTDEIFSSARALSVVGAPPDMKYHTRSDVMARVRYHPDDRERIAAEWRAALAGPGTEHEFEYRILRGAVQEPRWIRWKVFRDAAGIALRVIGVVADITETKLAADELLESEARFRALTELSSDWYWQQDENLRFVNYEPQEVGMRSGVAAAASLGKTRWEFDNTVPLSCTWEEHKAVLAARQPFRDFEYMRLDDEGTAHYTAISGVPTFDPHGRFTGYQGVGRNTSERRRFEAELRSRQEMLDLAQKAAQAVAFEWRIGADGPDHNRWSPELAAMYGIAPEAYDGSFEQWKRLVHPEDWPPVKEAIERAKRTGEVAAEYRVVHPDGSVHWLNAKGRMFLDTAGKPARMVGFMHDVTQRRHAEEEFRRMERQLRQAQRLEAMGTLAGGIAHDFNNILGAILGYGEMALRDAPKGSRLARDLDSIVVAGERGRALVDRVLAFSRSAVGERVPIHVENVVREALDLVSARLPANITLHAKLRTGRAAILGDATQVHQVLMNLASNSIQAMPAGGTLRVSIDASRVGASHVPAIGVLAAASEYVVLRVADTGTGIAPEILERIFDPFFTTKEVGTGTGLGLSLVHGIVTQLGGAIDVASVPGAGSTFTVYLPRSGDALDSSHREESELPRGDGQRVLIVDDEEPLVQIAVRTLEELGYAPVGFTSSAAALAAFRADPQRFDAVITDERMPGMSGSVLIREVRGIRGGIPVVLMSGFVGGAVASRARQAGAEEVLKKPLSARDLAASLARVLHP
jgi:PAS domain S-box-containing protein